LDSLFFFSNHFSQHKHEVIQPEMNITTRKQKKRGGNEIYAVMLHFRTVFCISGWFFAFPDGFSYFRMGRSHFRAVFYISGRYNCISDRFFAFPDGFSRFLMVQSHFRTVSRGAVHKEKLF
jgi:hypothetical protein